jgi:hypothetical protein
MTEKGRNRTTTLLHGWSEPPTELEPYSSSVLRGHRNMHQHNLIDGERKAFGFFSARTTHFVRVLAVE